MHGTDLHFTKDDATTNRYGRLTEAQAQLVDQWVQSWRERTVQSVVTFVALFWVVVVLGVGVEFNRWDGTFADFIAQVSPYIGFALVCVMIVLMLGLIWTFFMTQHIRKRRISSAEGKASTQRKTSSQHIPHYELTLKQGRLRRAVFQFSNELSLQYFENGKIYRLYYIKHYPLPLVLSAEEIP